MKNTFKFIAFAIGIAAAAVSCQLEITPTIKEEPVNLIIRAGSPSTKTAITNNGDGTYSPSWSASDAIGVYFTNVEGAATQFVNADAGETALFEPLEEITGVSGNQTLYAFYPLGAFNTATDGTNIRVNVKDTQSPQAIGTFDKTTDILVSRPYSGNIATINADGGIIDLAFARLLSVIKIIPADNTTGSDLAGEYVKSIKIEYNGSGGDAPLTGRVILDLDSGEFGEWTIKTYSASANYGESVFALDGANAAYLLVNPITISSGKAVTFTVKTNKHDAYKVFTLENDLSFPAGDIAKITLNINDTWTIEDNTIDPNIIFKAPFTADISSNTTYDSATHGDLGVVGTSKSTISYIFEGTAQLRNNNNKISADAASFYWCTSSTGLVIGGINTGTAQYFTLSFDRKVPSSSATLALTISEDGTHFFPITSTATVSITGTSATTSSYNFSIPAGEHTGLSIKFANSGSGVVIDNVTLTKLDSEGASSKAVSFEVVKVDPSLVVSPSPVNLLAGATQQLTVTGTNGTLHYSSNDTGVATVSDTGLITAVAEGTTTIDITSDASVDYNAGVTAVTVNVSPSLSFETVVISESWSANLKNSTGNNAKFVDDGQNIWTIDATYGHKAANNATAASFYSPKFDMSGVSAGSITFAHTGNVTGDSYQSLGKAYYTLDDGANWTQISLTNPGSNWAWQTATVSSAIYSGETIQFRWDFQGNASKTWEVKDFEIAVPAHSITVNSESSPLTVELNGDSSVSTVLTIASGYAWSVKSTTGQPSNYTYSIDSATQITITPAADNTSGSKNTGIGTMVLTDGVVDFSITFDQANKGGGSSTWTLVTDASSLHSGDIIVFAAYNVSYKASGTTYYDNKVMGPVVNQLGSAVDVTFGAGGTTIPSLPAGAQQYTLGGTTGAWTIMNGTKYLTQGEKKVTEGDSAHTWTISISENNAVVTSVTSSTYTLQYNPNSGNGRFATYSSSQKAIRIYRYE